MIRYIAALLFSAEMVFAQSGEDISQDTVDIVESVANAVLSEQRNLRWIQQAYNGDKETVISILERNGYTVDPKANWLGAADRFTVVSNAIAPGEIAFLVIPESEDAEPVSYAPLSLGLGIGGFGQYPPVVASHTSESIANRILDATRKSIAAVCGIGGQPESITGTASAAGIIEIEATWSGSNICDAVK